MAKLIATFYPIPNINFAIVKNAKNVETIINMIPEDKLLIETDSPYLSPEPMRGKRNNSMNVRYVAEKIAVVKNKTLEEIAKITSNNAKKIFWIK